MLTVKTRTESSCELVILYLWQRILSQHKSPYLSGLREPGLSDELPTTTNLNQLQWLPVLRVSGFSPTNLGELTCSYQWKKIQARIQWVLELWLKRPLPLKVTDKVITPYEMLEEQSLGWRVVTLPFDYAEDEEVVPGKHPLEFVLHDLEHAERFFHSEVNYYGQVGFYHHLQGSVAAGFWQKLLLNKDFEKAFYYLMSDMNTHCAHMLKYLRANLWNCFQDEANEIWFSLVNQWIQGQELRDAFLAINTNLENTECLQKIELYFVECGRGITRTISNFFLPRKNEGFEIKECYR